MIKSKNPEYQRLMNSVRWTSLRREYLMAHPLCEDCLLQGRSKLAEEVHHIQPIEDCRGNPLLMQERAYDRNNLRALCRPCHYQAHVALRSRSKEANRRRQSEATQNFIRRFLAPPEGE